MVTEGIDDIVAELLGRAPQGRYAVAVTRADGMPVVLVNEPFLDSGRPMPTRYWLIDPTLNKRIGTLESIGGVKKAEASVDPVGLRAAHDRYSRERDLAISPDHEGPRPSGGVGGTRQGVKCLHAHYGYYLAGGDDPVGRWVDRELRQSDDRPTDLTVHHRALSDQDIAAEGGETDDSTTLGGLVELGSGAIKFLASPDNGNVRRRYTTDLVSEMDDDGRLSQEGKEKLRAALVDIRATIRPTDDLRVVGTDAVRRHPGVDVAELVREILDTDIELLDGGREAALGYYAVAGRSAPPAADVSPVTIDIGRGSTELATMNSDGELCVMSLPIGAGTVTDAYLHDDPPRADELSAALSVIELHFDDLRREQPYLAAALTADSAQVVGLGAIRFVAEVELGRNDGDEIDGYQLERVAVEEVFRALATESAKDRATNPGLRPEHVDWVVGAICILVEMMRQFGVERLRTSTAGVLDGLAQEYPGLNHVDPIDWSAGPANEAHIS